ncbi:Predicted thiol-disulfide oxidoreductase YuxK, DCC family [Fictibacillus solisalsi]|uniref:Predicted thiol-disulfide oxidoreductase YuxK, DCC family n=1 Tax=Fictibacillus solisalsi TaxID=459525 RepID=A0A1H0A2U2_9BACL|nr:DUF393 domain-containing protein [Fictibacillus solisalsi]SDN27531.1 Predicted thiol-disulfide oxidoreductase YuxK, DCC family [Fictibacillus solisalsi]
MAINLKLIVFYDNWCPMCTNIKRRINRLDWCNLIQMEGIRENGIENKITVPLEELEKKMYAVIKSTGKQVSGIDALTAIAIRIPVLFPLWPFLKLSSSLGLGQKIYQYIADNRSIVPINKCDSSCQIK